MQLDQGLSLPNWLHNSISYSWLLLSVDGDLAIVGDLAGVGDLDCLVLLDYLR